MTQLKQDMQSIYNNVVRLESENEKLKDAIRLILPFAKGYVANHNFGSNKEYIEIAEQAIAKAGGA